MPTIPLNGANIHYDEIGAGPEALVFAHGLLFNGLLFDHVVAHFKDRYRCVTFDFRGHGQSETTRAGYDVDTLTEDAAALLRHLDVGPCHFAGLSLGGFVAMRLAVRHPDLVRSLILMDTTAGAEPNNWKYRLLSWWAWWFGMRSVIDRVMPILFGQKFLTDPARKEERETWRSRIIANDRYGANRATAGVIERPPFEEELARIAVPTLILVGEEDRATVPGESEKMQARIRGSRLVRIPGAAHSPPIEEPAAVNRALEEFLQSIRVEVRA